MSLIEKDIVTFTELLQSKSAVPGGGGASALVGSLGICLGGMVGALTVGKKKYADVEEEVKELMRKADDLRVRLLECVEKDAVAFEPLSKAYSIPKDDPSRDEVMEKCLKDAAAVPFEIAQLSCEAIELQKEFAEKGSKLAISDAATGAALCLSALYGAVINVKVNTASMKDREYAGCIDAKLEEMTDKYRVMATEIYEGVIAKFNK